MFENLPKNQHNDRILLPNSDRPLELPDGRIAIPSFVLREASRELILCCEYKSKEFSLRTIPDLHTILVPANSVTQITTRGLGFKLFQGAFIDATFVFNRSYEARHVGEGGAVTYRQTDRFNMPLKQKDFQSLIERLNLLKA